MPQTPHVEAHFTASEFVRDIVIGMADGLTVPFALAAGLTGAISQTHLIVAAGFAEIAAGSIAMGLGGFLAARGDAEHYEHEQAREENEVATIPDAERHTDAGRQDQAPRQGQSGGAAAPGQSSQAGAPGARPLPAADVMVNAPAVPSVKTAFAALLIAGGPSTRMEKNA